MTATTTSDAPDASVALLLPAQHAAPYLGISRTSLFALQASGDLLGVKVGGRRYWRRADLDAYAAGLAPEPPSPSATGRDEP